jgi:hypothetical protein
MAVFEENLTEEVKNWNFKSVEQIQLGKAKKQKPTSKGWPC